jgi:Tfp pilus assembly protein PilE
MQDAQALERCYSQSFAYAGCAGAAVGAAPSIGGKYTVTIAVPDPAAPAGTASYIITAVPLAAAQVADVPCQTFTLNTQGTQVALDGSNNPNTATCWGGT